MSDMRGHNSRMMGNWIAVSREMRDHPVVGMGHPVTPADPKRGSYSRYEAWQDLLMEAKFKACEANNKGKIVTLDRGQLMAARSWLAARWNWSEKTVRIFLDRLETEFMLRRERVQGASGKGPAKGQPRGNTINVITICNYNVYQTITELMELTEGHLGASQGPAKGQQGASQGPESNKETKKQADYSNATRPIVDALDSLIDQLQTAAGASLANPAACPGLLVMGTVNSWIEQGCDLQKDILPAIRARAAKAAPGSIRSWSYFTQEVVTQKATRVTPLPKGTPRAAPVDREKAVQSSWLQKEAAAYSAGLKSR